ncbi:MAG: hypothetical protein ACTSYE_01965 [Alphaproteobacteria bacterium]
MVNNDVARTGHDKEKYLQHTTHKRLETVGWALVFIWLGVSFLIGFEWPAILVGLGIITLGMQGVRVTYCLPFEGFWLIVGVVFLAAGLWEIVGAAEAALVPIALTAAGVVLIGKVFWQGGISGG